MEKEYRERLISDLFLKIQEIMISGKISGDKEVETLGVVMNTIILLVVNGKELDEIKALLLNNSRLSRIEDPIYRVLNLPVCLN
jgi:hypothetical protein